MVQYFPVITGSLTVNGNLSVSGNVAVTGSMSGTSSLAANAELLSGTGSVGFTTTGSFTEASSSLSSRTSQIESIYATTGSNSFRATQSITGSLTVTGQIVAQTLNVQQVTSSIVYSSGSNVFGCDLNSRQTFTGSVLMTGSLIVNTTGPELQVNNNGVILGNLLTDNHSITGSLRITGSSITLTGALTGSSATFSNNIAAACINISGNARFYSAGNWMQFEENVLTSLNNDGAHIRSVVSADSAPTYTWRGDTDTGMYTPGANTIAFSTAAVERVRITNCGNVGIGATPSAWASPFVAIQGGSFGQYLGFQTNAPDIKVGANHYYNGSNYIYTTSNGAAQLNVAGNLSLIHI